MSDAAQELRQFNVKELSRRNGETAQQGLRDLDSRISQLHAVIAAQQQGMAAMTFRIEEFEKALIRQKVLSVGTGPTAR